MAIFFLSTSADANRHGIPAQRRVRTPLRGQPHSRHLAVTPPCPRWPHHRALQDSDTITKRRTNVHRRTGQSVDDIHGNVVDIHRLQTRRRETMACALGVPAPRTSSSSSRSESVSSPLPVCATPLSTPRRRNCRSASFTAGERLGSNKARFHTVNDTHEQKSTTAFHG